MSDIDEYRAIEQALLAVCLKLRATFKPLDNYTGEHIVTWLFNRLKEHQATKPAKKRGRGPAKKPAATIDNGQGGSHAITGPGGANET